MVVQHAQSFPSETKLNGQMAAWVTDMTWTCNGLLLLLVSARGEYGLGDTLQTIVLANIVTTGTTFGATYRGLPPQSVLTVSKFFL